MTTGLGFWFEQLSGLNEARKVSSGEGIRKIVWDTLSLRCLLGVFGKRNANFSTSHNQGGKKG